MPRRGPPEGLRTASRFAYATPEGAVHRRRSEWGKICIIKRASNKIEGRNVLGMMPIRPVDDALLGSADCLLLFPGDGGVVGGGSVESASADVVR